MARLTTKQRAALPASSFALPKQRAFPVNDTVHAQKALQLAPRAVAAGSITPAQAAAIRAKAKAKLAVAKPNTLAGIGR